jgi:Protein of unknown function (DUF1552)
MTNWNLRRRDLLKSLGVGAACLPLLQASKSWAQTGPKRFVVLQMSEGLRIAAWKPNPGSLMGQTLPFASAAFESVKQDMIFIPGLGNPGGGGGHGSYGCIYYGLGSTGGGQYKEPTGKTIDQIIAQGMPKPASGIQSIHLHVQLDVKPTSTPSPGGRRCFWNGQGQPINPVGDPLVMYKQIFGNAQPTMGATNQGDLAETKKMLAEKKSILDYVGKSLEEFKNRLGNEDKVAIGAHFQSIRDLETQLASAPVDGTCAGTAPGMFDMENQAHYPMILKAHTNIMVAALKCGVTNVATLQTGDSSGNNINFAFVPGLPEKSKNNYKSPFRNWHDLGHNPVMDGVDHKRIVDKWFFDRWVEMFNAMKAAPEAGGSLFDNTVILIGNHVEDGGNHNTGATPWMLAGGKNFGYFNLGTCTPAGGAVKSVMANLCEAFKVNGSMYGGGKEGVKKA